MSAWAIIVAGGLGQRMGTDIPKQLLKLGGITILERTLKPFIRCPEIECIIIVSAAGILEKIPNTISNTSHSKKILIIEGGPERQDSVLNGLTAVPADVDIVIIHDAVRPFISSKIITECVHSARDHGAVTVMRPLKETVKIVSNGVVAKTPDRSSFWITQTPQAFKTLLIKKAHTNALNEGFTGTDDCMLVERLGHPVHIIEGNDLNIKITTSADLTIAGAILNIFENRED